jgi:hypothetical protein
MQREINGMKVRITHYRYVRHGGFGAKLVKVTKMNRNEFGGTIQTKGGLTIVAVELPNGNVVRGVANCSPQDNYNKRVGREIAFGRLLKKLEHGFLDEQDWDKWVEWLYQAQ